MIETVADHLTLEQTGRVAVVTVNRPDARNAMTFEMYDALHALCDRLDADAAVRVVILRGAGDKAFVSGTDIRQFQAFKTKEDALGYEARISRVLTRIAGLTKPSIAMIQGDAVGGGLFMSLACDLRLAAEHARLTMAAVKEAIRRYIAAVTPKDLEDLILSCYLSSDFHEGVRAFLEKRKANWQGR